MKIEKGKISIFKIDSKDTVLNFDKQTPWFLALLEELHEDLDKDDEFFVDFRPNITFKGELVKKDKGTMGDIAILKGDLALEFCTYDVQTGEMMSEELEVAVAAVYMDAKIRDELGYQDETSFLIETQEHDLYFYENNTIDLAEVLHEYIFLNKDPYPTKNRDS